MSEKLSNLVSKEREVIEAPYKTEIGNSALHIAFNGAGKISRKKIIKSLL